ncbi:MAG: endonuclease Q family protein [bacterium]|nr:endonuclease Q family protein [bacterium]
MRVVADLHIHSKYAMATSKFMVPEYIAKWAFIKGINVIATGDCTHPLWVRELKNKLEPAEEGLFRLSLDSARDKKDSPRFIITGEVSSIYNQGGHCRRIHTLFFVPSFEVLDKINAKIAKVGKVYSDGRPIIGMSAKGLAEIIFDASEDCVIVPAHIWTPWFGLLGSKSGFDSIEECFGELSPKIFALETGLSSDPPMNWRLSALDKYALISNSDAHSGMNLMREANIFDLKQLTYKSITNAIKAKDPREFLYTIEYFPQEGMYHWDGHREHDVCMSPEESEKLNNICPVCSKMMTIGVDHRVCDLADREIGVVPKGKVPCKHLMPLDEVIMQSFGVKSFSKKGEKIYYELIEEFGNEFNVLMETEKAKLESICGERLTEAIIWVREEKLTIRPGYDGVYGEVKIFE